MIPLPDWAPNIHPILVHFPIALLVVAVIMDAAALFLKERSVAYSAAVILFVAGALGALAAFFTGRDAGDNVSIPALAQTTLTDHADWALLTVWFFGLFAIIRLGLSWYERKNDVILGRKIDIVIFILGAAGLFLLVQTGDNGAKMVFQYGVGTQLTVSDSMSDMDESEEHEHDDGAAEEHEHDDGATEEHEHDESAAEEHEHDAAMSVNTVVDDNGSWAWTPGSDDFDLGSSFEFVQGTMGDLITASAGTGIITLSSNGPVLFVQDSDLVSIEANVVINTDDFDGSVRLIHHVQDASTYDFLSLENGMIRQGRSTAGKDDVFDEKAYSGTGWKTLRAVGDGTHFRGYIGDELLVHGHGDELPAGPVGLRLEGLGSVQLKGMGATVLR
jgi:uncharacterized membrane protein